MKTHIENDKCKGKVEESRTKVKEEPSASSDPARATVLIESPMAEGCFRRFHVKLRNSRVMGEFLDRLLQNSGYDPDRVEWLCDERLLTGEETASLLHNKTVKYRFIN